MEKIELQIDGITYNHSKTSSYVLVLSEKDGNRRIPIIIGHYEARSIALELEKIKPSRPFTHDLFYNFSTSFQILVTEVNIVKFSEGIFYASISCSNGEKTHEIDARTTDAVALAIRFRCPIYASNDIIEQTCIILEIEENANKEDVDDKEEPSQIISEISTEKLQQKLNRAIEKENYELASIIRDELNKRK